MPSTYMSGWFPSEKLEAPRIRMREPEPTAPVAGCTSTPGARPISRLWTSLIGAVCTMFAASIRETAFPIWRCSVAPGLPVTITWESSSAFCSRASRTLVSPTLTVSVRARNPIMRT
jgi:hypothetical protein